MKLLDVRYTPSASVKFTREEVKTLIRCSERHYDGKCRRLSQPGGLLWGMQNKLRMSGNVTWTMNFGELDTLAKVTELDAHELSLQLGAVLHKLTEAYHEENT